MKKYKFLFFWVPFVIAGFISFFFVVNLEVLAWFMLTCAFGTIACLVKILATEDDLDGE